MGTVDRAIMQTVCLVVTVVFLIELFMTTLTFHVLTSKAENTIANDKCAVHIWLTHSATVSSGRINRDRMDPSKHPNNMM
jgi:hypothetical protein